MLTNPPPVFNAVSAAWNTVATFDDYAGAQRAVDRLSDDGFGVDKLDIVGSDLRLIERVTGRLTKARAAGAGAVSGMWAGTARAPAGNPVAHAALNAYIQSTLKNKVKARHRGQALHGQEVTG
jgi:hypothetical protein